MPGALDGTRVLELGGYITAPYAGMLLGDMGAEVIKIESPEGGDAFRNWGKPGYNPTFEALNRNKKSVAIDLKTPEGTADFLRLTKSADVILENLRNGVMDRLGFGYQAISAVHPGIVYCSITGFGSSGPYESWPGYDTVGVGMGGMLSLITDLKNPQPSGYAFSDHFAGMFAAQGILAALLARTKSRRGQHVQTSLLEVTVAAIGENAARYFYDGEVPDRASRNHLAQVYACLDRDGRPFLIHLSSPLKFWDGLLATVNRPEWRDDPRFRGRVDRMKNYDALHAELNAICKTESRDHWLNLLRKNDVPSGPLYTLEEVFADPQVKHLGLKQRVDHPSQGSIELVAPGIHMSDTPVTIRAAAPLLGQHNKSTLT